jgi:putative membrane protein
MRNDDAMAKTKSDKIEIKVKARRDWREWLKAFILLGLCLYFIVLVVTGDLANYINLRFMWLSYVGLAIFLVLGLWSVYRLLKPMPLPTHPNAHMPLSWGAISVAAIPLVFGLLPSQPLSVDAISGGVSLAPVGGVSAAASQHIAPENRNVLDWLREFNRVESPATLDGLPVDVVAFVYREPGMTADQFMAARFTLSCCVADAFAIGLPVDYAGADQYADGTWVRVQGTLQAGEFDGEFVPIIQPTQIEAVDEPRQPYLYS